MYFKNKNSESYVEKKEGYTIDKRQNATLMYKLILGLENQSL